MQHYQVTLTTSGTAYSALALVRALSSTYKDNPAKILIESDDGNASNNIYMGSSAVTTANYGHKLVGAGSAYQFPDKTTLSNLWLVADASSQMVDIFIPS